MRDISEGILGLRRSIPQTRSVQICLLSSGVIPWPDTIQEPLWPGLHSAAWGVTCLDKEGFLWGVLPVHPELGTLSTGQLKQDCLMPLQMSLAYVLCAAADPDKSLCLYETDVVYIQRAVFICCDMEEAQWL